VSKGWKAPEPEKPEVMFGFAIPIKGGESVVEAKDGAIYYRVDPDSQQIMQSWILRDGKWRLMIGHDPSDVEVPEIIPPGVPPIPTAIDWGKITSTVADMNKQMAALAASAQKAVAVSAPRGVGKSSLIKAMAEALKEPGGE
jgi:hypothetical protein